MHGRPFCGRNCPVPKTAAAQPAIDDFDLMVRHADGGHLLVNIGASYIPPELRAQAGEVAVLFGLRQVHPQRLLRRMATAPRETGMAADRSAAGRRYRLTSREQEVLRLAASGMKTGQIAGRLSVSTQTVRTHFKNIYPKLGVNSRIEAVIYAIRHDIH
jgi:DNA-binding NarL/FixJ family response regulator